VSGIRLVHTFGKNAGEVQTLDKEVVKVGRAPDNDVVFDADYDLDASGHHAELRKEPDGWVLVDLESKNGTWIKGQRVSKKNLVDGEEIGFGPRGPRVRVEFVRTSAVPVPVPVPAAPRPKKPMPPTAAFQLPPEIANLPLAGDPVSARRIGKAPANPHAPRPIEDRPPPPQSRAAVMAPHAGKKVGKRTIAQMIQDAVSARRPRSTIEIGHYVDQKVKAATAGQQRTTLWLGFLLIAALGALGVLVLWSRRSHDEIDQLRGELARLAPEDPRRKDIENRLGTLHPANANYGRTLYDSSKKGIFMLASGGEGFCTAFAVRPSVLATNAHCIVAARRHGGSVVALENEGHGQVSFPVVDTRVHPGYRDEDQSKLTPDVGIVNISGKAAVVLELASAQELAQLGAGDEVYMIGFPGRLMDASNPSATFLAAHVGRITTPQGRPGAFESQWLVQHDAATTHGTSGSPMFDGKGHVVAINSGGYVESDEASIAGRKTEVVRASPYKFGMRIDLLNAILR
jgi:V8-like Glu-specific endopeptidase